MTPMMSCSCIAGQPGPGLATEVPPGSQGATQQPLPAADLLLRFWPALLDQSDTHEAARVRV